MKEELVSFETAKLAKEKGFNWICRLYYEDWDGGRDEPFEPISADNYNNINKWDKVISVPTQSLLQKWLREKQDLIVIINNNDSGFYWEIKEDNYVVRDYYDSYFEECKYEDALEVGLQEALKLIK